MDLFSWAGSVLVAFGQFLSGTFDMTPFIPLLLCVLVATIFNPKGPTDLDQLVVSFAMGSIGAYLFVLLLKGTQADAIILALIVLAIGLVWMCVKSAGWLGRVISGILALGAISAVFAVSELNPDVGVLPDALNLIWSSAATVISTAIQSIQAAQ